MADTRDVAIALAAVLGSTTEPEPFPVTLKGQSLPDAALIVREIIRECVEAGVTLSRVKVGPELMGHLRDSHLPGQSYLGVELLVDDALQTELLLVRGSEIRAPPT